MSSYYEERDRINSNVEKRVLSICEDHVRKVVDAIKELRLMVDDWQGKNTSKIEQRLKQITTLEKDADKDKRTILKLLSEATSLIQRDDLMHLVMKLDQIIDYAESTAYIITGLSDSSESSLFQDDVVKMMDPVDKVVSVVREIIRLLTVDIEKALKNAEKIDILEREVDSLHRDLKTRVLRSKMTCGDLYQFLDLIAHLEEIADLCEDAADAVRIFGMGR